MSEQKDMYKDQIEVIVGALIVNGKNEVLLGKQKKWGGKWSVFGGHVEFGEKLDEAVLREVKEETNCDVEIVDRIRFDEKFAQKGDYAGRHLIFLDFVCSYNGSDDDIKLNEEYEPDFKWFTLEDALREKLGGGTKEFIETYQKYIAQKDAVGGWQRCMADFANYKKRQVENQKELVEFAGQNVLTSLLPVLDNFYSATSHVPEEQKDSPWLTGIMFIQQQLDKVLEDNGMVEIRVEIGDDFDPQTMEAITENVISRDKDKDKNEDSAKDSDAGDEIAQNTQEAQEQKVTKIISKGYKVGQKILRPARVVVE